MSKSEQPTDASLVPLIRTEEARLHETLKLAEVEAEARLAEARQAAHLRIKQAKDTFADVIKKTYGKKVETLDMDVANLRAYYQQEVKTIAEMAQARIEPAVKRIRSLVIPEGAA